MLNMTGKIILLIIIVFSTNNIVFPQKKSNSFEKGDFRLEINLPHFNYLSFNPNKEFKDSEFGFNGYGLGFEYNYSENRFLGVNSSYVITFELPFPAPVDSEYNKILSSFSLNLTDNLIKNRFTFGYGINFSINTWKEWTRDFDQINLIETSSKTIDNRNIGLTFNSYYRLGKTIHLGLIYQPSLLNLNNKPQFIYEHQISLAVKWKFRLFNL
jgi:hypothetical protein